MTVSQDAFLPEDENSVNPETENTAPEDLADNASELEEEEAIESVSVKQAERAVPASVSVIPSELNPIRTIQVLRIIGYGLLMLSTIDLLYILIPPEFTKPIWEYQTMGDMIRLIPVPMLAFMFVFYGETMGRKRFERPMLFTLSWSTLIFGILFLLMIPLTVVDTMRINQYNSDQINIQAQQQKLRITNTRNQIAGASPDDLEKLIPRPTEQQRKTQPNLPKTRAEAKSRVIENLDKAQTMADEEADKAKQNVENNLIKNSTKMVLEALIGSSLFFYAWFMTPWARRRIAGAYEEAGNGKGRRKRSSKKKASYGKNSRRLRRS